MNKEIKDVGKGVMRITTLDERFYALPKKSKLTGLPEYAFFPSSTWIAGYYPKGIAFYKWLAQKGWDEAESIKVSAGDRGSRVHYACEQIDIGKGINIEEDTYPSSQSEELKTLEPQEIEAVVSYRDFIEEVKPELLCNEMTIFGDDYAGTLDKILRIKGQIWIVDLKTSKYIWEEHKLQIASYSHAKIAYQELEIKEEEWKNRKLAILQVGYKLNKKHWKFTEIEDKYEMFRVAYKIWDNENPEAKPKQIEYPLVIESAFRKEEVKKIRAKKVIK